MPKRARGMFAASLVVATALVVGTVAPAQADDYPTWADVEKAKKNEKLKKEQIERIEKLIDELEATDAGLARDALEVGEQYNIANDALDEAQRKADALTAQADAAAATAAESRAQAEQLVAYLVRSGRQDVSLSLLLDSANSDDLLWSLGAMEGLSGRTAATYESALVDANAASALAEQSAVAEEERADAAATAKSARDTARQAAKAAKKSLDAQKARAQTLYDQLSSLKGTTSDTEKAYQEGLAWEKAQEQVKMPPKAPPLEVTPAAPNGSAVDGAIAFARAQVGDQYVLGGAGPDTWDCSGLTQASYAAVGVYIGTHSATNQYATMAAANRLLPLTGLAAGDLLFYSAGGSTTATKYHVAIYLGAGQMIEAPYPGAPVRVKPIRYGDLVPYAGRPTP